VPPHRSGALEEEYRPPVPPHRRAVQGEESVVGEPRRHHHHHHHKKSRSSGGGKQRATIVGNPMFSAPQPHDTLGLDDLGMNYHQIRQYFDNLKESNA
jgi:hypothetical protein